MHRFNIANNYMFHFIGLFIVDTLDLVGKTTTKDINIDILVF